MINPPQVLPEEPTAVTPHGGFCGGKSQQWLRYPTNPLVRICAGGVRRRTSLPRTVNRLPAARHGAAQQSYSCVPCRQPRSGGKAPAPPAAHGVAHDQLEIAAL